jgi:hypothetical protein
VKGAAFLLLLVGCAGDSRAPDASVPGRHTVPDGAAAAAPRSAAPEAAPPDEGAPADGEDLAPAAEEKDPDPRSPTVKLKLIFTPPARGTVVWGRKKLAELQPGQMTVEIERPRNSGPLDLLVRADGFLPHHVRLFTDRDDHLSVRLFRPGDARGLLGYHPSAPRPPL